MNDIILDAFFIRAADFFMRPGLSIPFRARWTEAIHDRWIRNLLWKIVLTCSVNSLRRTGIDERSRHGVFVKITFG